jgi:hypothetical protein
MTANTVFSVSSSTCRGFKALVCLSIITTGNTNNLYQMFDLIGIYTQASTGWYFVVENYGDNSGATFAISSAGVVTCTLTSIPSGTFSSLKITYKVITLTQ